MAVVTGANRGIGLAVASALAARGMRVLMVVRDEARSADAVRVLRGNGADVLTVVGDLGSNRTTRDLAKALQASTERVDLLVHNAGLWPAALERNEDGFERAFAVNHLAPFALNMLLEPLLVASRARVVQVTAGLYVKAVVDLERTPRGEDFHAIRTYATTKAFNLLLLPRWTERWTSRWSGRGPTIDAVHPGVIRTGLGDRPGAFGHVLRLVKRLWKTPEEGARPVVRLACEEPRHPRGGRYLEIDEEKELLPFARDEALARAVWDQALAATGLAGKDDPSEHRADAHAET